MAGETGSDMQDLYAATARVQSAKSIPKGHVQGSLDLFVNGDYVARFERHIGAIQQHLWSNLCAFALARDDDFLRVMLAEIFRRGDGLRERQTLHPRHVGILHRTDDRDARRLRLLPPQSSVLPGEVSRLRLGLGLRF